MKWLFMALMVLVIGCQPLASVSDPVVARAIAINNTTVAAMREIQESTRQMRKEALELIAKTAPSVAQGKAKMDALDERHRVLIAIFAKCERAQNRLADALDAAASILGDGRVPNLDEVLSAYAALQALYAELTKEAATWTR